MSFFEKNLACIKDSHTRALLKETPPCEMELLKTRTGALTGKLGQCLLHSRFDPVKEARNFLDKEIRGEISGAIFYGFGFGYYLEEFLKQHPRLPVLVCEPDRALFRRVMDEVDLTFFLSSPKVSFIFGKEDEPVLEAFKNLPQAEVRIIKIRSVYTKDREYYEKLDKSLRTFLSRKEINMNTLTRFGKLWVRNLARNCSLLTRMPGIIHLKERFKGIPSLVLASGPTLDRILPHLKELAKRCLIISVDTSVRACLAVGVEPDFIVVVDPQYWNTRHLDGVVSRSSFLVSESSTHPGVFSKLPLKGFFAGSSFPLGQYFERATEEKGQIGAGGSVATSAWDLAGFIGCSPLWIAGLDLGFPGKQTHFKGAFFEKAFYGTSTRLCPTESLSFKYLHDAAPTFKEANNGGRVLTDKRMIVYKSWFETHAKQYPHREGYNLSARGLKIDGLPLGSLEDLLALPERREELEKIKSQFSSLFQEACGAALHEPLKAALDRLLENLKELEELGKKGLRRTLEIRKLLGQKRDASRELEKLNRLDAKIMNHHSKEIAGFLLQPIVHNIVNTNMDGKPLTDIVSQSSLIYTKLKESAGYHYEVLSGAFRFFS